MALSPNIHARIGGAPNWWDEGWLDGRDQQLMRHPASTQREFKMGDIAGGKASLDITLQ
jgi:hypothetical protein